MKEKLIGLGFLGCILIAITFGFFLKPDKITISQQPIQEVSVINESMILQKYLNKNYTTRFGGNSLDSIRKGISLKNHAELTKGINNLSLILMSLPKDKKDLNSNHLKILAQVSHSIILLTEVGQSIVVNKLLNQLTQNISLKDYSSVYETIQNLDQNKSNLENLQMSSDLIYIGLLLNNAIIQTKGSALFLESLEKVSEYTPVELSIIIPLIVNYPYIRNSKMVSKIYQSINKNSNNETIKEMKIMFGIIMNDTDLLKEK